jgi:tetrahydromethanopterin S-methyltransferase subunit G
MDSCEYLVWDDELDEVEAVNEQRRAARVCTNCQRMRDFCKEIGNEIGKDIKKKLSECVIVGVIMCLILFAMLIKM